MGANAIRILIAFAVVACEATAQQGGQYSLAGTVVNSRTGEPVKRALVSLMRFNDPEAPNSANGGQPAGSLLRAPTTTFTDSAGGFRFSALAPGQYLPSVQKPGFVQAQREESDENSINLTSSVEGYRLGLSPLGAIEGKVVDQDGQPLRGVNVMTRSVQILDGLKQKSDHRTVVTDDRGMYRVWDLMPGKYYIDAAGRSGGTYLYAGDSSPQYNADRAFMPRYFGGGRTLESAAPIQIEAGTQATADVSVTLEPAYKVRGSLTNFVPRRTVKFQLFAGDEDLSASRVSVNGDTGKFEIQDVVNGSYTLRVTQGETVAEAAVSVNGKDVDGIAAQLMPGVDIKAVTRFIGQPPTAAANEDRFQTTGFCALALNPGNGRGAKSYSAPKRNRQASEDPVIGGALPGIYRVAINCFGGYLTSAMYGSQDLLTNPIITVQPGAVSPSLEVTAAYGGGSVIGTLSAHHSEAGQAAVLLAPQFSTSGAEVAPAVSADETGPPQFFFANLAPGRYVAYAFSKMDNVEFRNPEFLKSLTGGVSVEVRDQAVTKIAIESIVR